MRHLRNRKKVNIMFDKQFEVCIVQIMLVTVEEINYEVHLEFLERDDEVGQSEEVEIGNICLEGSDIDLQFVLDERIILLIVGEITKTAKQ